ncbi:hypothetical protein QFZ22_003219 [Streptomyces canus]|uniref:DUF3558 domain-containing protein n=1 Tax=Streptomyces canus TaxID=58343 RepID=A0AAW8FAX5_9ACTN|nr:hypothetical protein [Streptomyces canus]MDQ0907234.1 hypothetical protein [Streptomyces canus]
MLTAAAGCSPDEQTNDQSKPVCDGKLKGDVFDTLVGDSGVADEKVSKFSPNEWTAGGYCYLYGKKHAVEIDYLWRSDSTSDLDRYRSPGPSTVKTFKVGPTTGYLERPKVRVAAGNVNQNRAWLALPCPIPGEKTRDHAMLEIEVKEPPPARSVDDSLSKAFISALTIATSYLGDEVFKCSASPSAAAPGAASPTASSG